MAAYNAEMNRRLYAAAGRLSDAERRAPRGAFWGSLHGTLVHILWGDSQWMSRFDNWPRPSTPIKQSDHFIEDFGELRAARDKADANISRWAAKVDEAWLAEDLVWFSYSEAGADALRVMFSALIEGLRDVPQTILDFPCGSDRVTRHFIPFFAHSRVFRRRSKTDPVRRVTNC
jgi:hypothetical protein